ncbi:MAG: TonB-dependent receptor [Alphaproteobacteria bacterium]|nr:TonB-dependent receptor [Alphaproteobacteria bacterium]MBN9567512.1 TonB-dependent receptor [Alphaproteobacteria bacterium]MBN9592648.1 TonB-dependent receptor [Alphaproteobacteria bacterium]
MIELTNGRSSLRSALLLGAASAAAFGLSTPAFAQDQSVETVIVTGSRIPQQGLYSSSPVTAVGQQEMQFQGTTGVENLVNSLPSAFADQGGNLANGATGTATANLRNLGANRTLVLIDGKRLMPGDPSAAGRSTAAPDLNFIPAALVDHVEVLTGGASSVYGSDAVAGVVNFIMRKDFEGIELDAQYGVAQHTNGNDVIGPSLDSAGFPLVRAPSSLWDGGTVDATLIMGANTADGKGNVTLYAGYRNIQKVLQGARDWSSCAVASNSNPQNGLPATLDPRGFTCLGSSNAAVGNIRSQDSFLLAGPDGVLGTDDDIQQNPNFGTAYRSLPGGSLEPYVGSRDAYNFAPLNYLQRPDERYMGGGFAHYEVNKAFDVFANFMFMDDHTVAQIAPSGYFRGTAPFNGNMHVNCDNPFLGSATNPNSPFSLFCQPLISQGLIGPTDDVNLQVGRRFVEAGDRQDDLRHTDYRIVVGVKGDLGDSWNYEVFGQYGTSIYAENYLNDTSVTRQQNALQVVDVGGVPTCKSVIAGTDASCVPYNLFDLNGLTPDVIKYLATPGFKEGSTVEQVVGANIAGDLGQWGIQSPWAQAPVAVSVGTEYRQESLTLRTDALFTSGDLAGQGGPTPSVNGSYNVAEGFGEIRVPIVQGMPFAEDLTANAGYRYSSYNLSGVTSSYKYGLEWQPIDDFRLRGSYARAVRAPNVVELFSQRSIGLWGGADPCGTNPTLTAAQCANTGLPAGLYGNPSLDCPAGQCSALFGGNQSLKPESADSWTAGIVFTPTFLDGFTATIDYFNIKVKGLINTLPQQTVISGCALSGAPFLCNLIHRGTGTGIIFGTTAGYVESLNTNTGFLKNEGVDVEINYQTDLDQWGMGPNGALAINLVGTYTGSYATQPIPPAIYEAAGLPEPHVYECSGRYGNVCGTPTPKWRHKLRVTWSAPWDFDISVAWRFIGGSSVDFNTDNPLLNGLCGGPCGDLADAHIGTYNYFDLAGTWTVREGVNLRAGVTNLFDKDPPILDSSYVAVPPYGSGNTFPQVYDSLGRVFFVGATLKY